MEQLHKTTSGSSEPHSPPHNPEGVCQVEGSQDKAEKETSSMKAGREKQEEKHDYLARIRESHEDLGDLREENLAEYTSLLVAYMRAIETERDDAIIHDPYAQLLAGDAGATFLQLFSKWSPNMNTMSDFTALRTRNIDEALMGRHESIQQVVILGAGLDSRAYRMKTLSDCLVIEIDASASMMMRKEKLLQEAGARVLAKTHHVVIADLEQDSWQTKLVETGFNPQAPTFWLLEGLLYYMSYDSNVRLIKTLDALSAPQSQLWADISGFGLVQGGDDNPEGFFRTRALKYGENDPQKGVLSLLKWPLQILASLEKPCDLYGREWQPLTLFSSAKGEEEIVPWFFVEASKTQAHPSPAPLL